MSGNSRGCVTMCILATLCGGCVYYSSYLPWRKAREKSVDDFVRARALVAEYAPELPAAIKECEEQMNSWDNDLQSLSQTIRSVGKNPLVDPDVKQSMQVRAELGEVLKKLKGAEGDLLIALKKTEVQTGKGDEETRIKRAQTLVATAVADSQRAIRIAAAKQRQIKGAISPEELSEATPSTGAANVALEPETRPAAEAPHASTPISLPSTTPEPAEKTPTTSDPTTPKELEPELIDSQGLRLKLVDSGEFMMGAEKAEIDSIVARTRSLSDKAKDRLASELPRHRVKISRPFYIGVTEVTVGQFAKFQNSTDYTKTAETNKAGLTWRKPGFSQEENYPVTAISWLDAVAFCQWLSETENAAYRLPTEAEWEFACRAGSQKAWFWSDKPDQLGNYAWSVLDSAKKTRPVATKESNALGLFDMQGNVSEWCQDRYQAGYYVQSPISDPPGPSSGEERVIRGGSILLSDPSFFRSSLRGSIREGSALVGVGFRVLREAK